MTDSLWLVTATILMFIAMSWLALSLPAHWKQVRDGLPDSVRLRLLGWSCVLLSGGACLQADHPSMAVLVWIMLAAVAAFSVGQLLSTRPGWLRLLATSRLRAR